MLACHDLTRNWRNQVFLDTKTGADVLKSYASCSLAYYSGEMDALCDLVIATGVECHGTNLWAPAKVAELNGLWTMFSKVGQRPACKHG